LLERCERGSEPEQELKEVLMLISVLGHLRRNFIAYLALFIASSGTAYAGFKLPPNSVTTREVKDRTLIAKDFRRNQLPLAVGAALDGRAAAPLAPPDTLWEGTRVTVGRNVRLLVLGHVDSLSLACEGGPCSVDVGLYLGSTGIPHSGRTLTSTCDASGCRIEAGQQDLIGLTDKVSAGTYDVTLCTRVRTGTVVTGGTETAGEIAALTVTSE
jgi:hypothetical protein